MRKLVALALAGILAVGLTGCNPDPTIEDMAVMVTSSSGSSAWVSGGLKGDETKITKVKLPSHGTTTYAEEYVGDTYIINAATEPGKDLTIYVFVGNELAAQKSGTGTVELSFELPKIKE